jgi:phosphatidylserine/phosphatidylglycerophosphate/cardiolipin synthase-like enzyme
MRFKNTDNGVSVQAIAGTYVVMLGFDMAEADTNELLGFAIHRTQPEEDEAYWLTGMRTFEASYPNPPDGALVSTQEHPVQDFLWSDFTTKPGRKYTYRVVPVSGKPKNLKYGAGVSIDVETEKEAGGKYSVYFNRAVIGSQAYARKFGASPSALKGKKKEEAYEWLSRGLFEAIQGLLAKAKDESFGIRAAVYEFSYEPVIEAFAKAQQDCKDVQIVYDARIVKKKDGTIDAKMKKRVDEVKALLKKHDLFDVATPRIQNPRYISHNKFIILLQNQEPVAVWTGSTNFSESGIFGHANVGHLVRDKHVAAQYLAYWERLKADPLAEGLRPDNDEASPTLDDFPPPDGITTIFSPREDLGQLKWYGTAMNGADNLVCFTAAFGVNLIFREVFKTDKDYLRYVFLEKWGVNAESAKVTEDDLTKDFDIQVAVGAVLPDQILYHWLHEFPNSLSVNVRFVHTKFMLVDPLGPDPIVISGSANFSDASTTDNDENMLIIRGDTRIADIYLGEFMRLWRHHRFRFIVKKINEETGAEEGHNYLDPTSKWTKNFYKAGSVKFKRRTTFAPKRALDAINVL